MRRVTAAAANNLRRMIMLFFMNILILFFCYENGSQVIFILSEAAAPGGHVFFYDWCEHFIVQHSRAVRDDWYKKTLKPVIEKGRTPVKENTLP